MSPEPWEFDLVEAEAIRNRKQATQTFKECSETDYERPSIPSVILTSGIIFAGLLMGFLTATALAAF